MTEKPSLFTQKILSGFVVRYDDCNMLFYFRLNLYNSPQNIPCAPQLRGACVSHTAFIFSWVLVYFSFSRISPALIPLASSFFSTASASVFLASSAVLASAFAFFAFSFLNDFSASFDILKIIVFPKNIHAKRKYAELVKITGIPELEWTVAAQGVKLISELFHLDGLYDKTKDKDRKHLFQKFPPEAAPARLSSTV